MVCDIDVDLKQELVEDRDEEVKCGVGVRNDQEEGCFGSPDLVKIYRVAGEEFSHGGHM